MVSLSAFLPLFGAVLLAAPSTALANATITFDTKGDTHYDTVYDGAGPEESLSRVVSQYRDPDSGELTPILAADGRELVVGSVAKGENPAQSDQSQVQRFLVSGADESFKVRYLGLGGAGYRSIFGAYYYPLDGSLDDAVYAPLLTQNVSPIGAESTFTVPEDHYFGFYLDANGYVSSQGQWYTENEYNTDSTAASETDHFLMFNTNRGLMFAIEDLPKGPNGRLGDQDYEDLLVGFVTKANGDPLPMPASRVTPEPSSAVLWLLLGLTAAARQRGRRIPNNR